MYELSRLVLPTAEYLDNENLFVNKVHNSYYMYKFNTWMNIFPAKKYFQYCKLEDLYLEIKIDTNAEILIYGFNYNEASQNNDELVYKSQLEAHKEVRIKIDFASQYENLYFCLVSDTDFVNIEKAVWSTMSPPVRVNKLAIVSCTFKRENYVLRNAYKFNEFIKDNPELENRIKLYIVDNGRTLSKEVENQNIKIFPNKNAGGAGGFTRGIIEARNSGEDFTRILLMDDDVEIFPESFYRTLVLADYLKPEYEKSFIHGAMLNLYKKNLFFESTAIKTSNWCYSYHGQLDISMQYNVGKTNYTPAAIFEDEEQKVSSAWWYCCFSMKSVEENGLPLPVFFRCDDIEWSWRNYGEQHITVNGICVWHAPFEWRVSKPVEYYFSKRNIAMVNMLYTEDYKPLFLTMVKKDFKHLLKILDYTSCDIYLRMMEDLSKGSVVYRRDPERVLKEVMEYSKADVIEETTNQIYYEKMKKKYNRFLKQKKYYRQPFYFLKKAFWEITLRGRLVPEFLWKKKKEVWLNAPSEEYLFTKTVYTRNLATLKTEIRTYDVGRVRLLKKRFKSLYREIDKNYEVIRNDFCNAKEEFKTETFWREYLGI